MRTRFQIARYGTPLKQYPVKGGIDTGIEYQSIAFLEYEVCWYARLDLWKWELGQYPIWFRERVFAWYNTHLLIEMHKQDAENKAAERQARKNKRRSGGFR